MGFLLVSIIPLALGILCTVAMFVKREEGGGPFAITAAVLLTVALVLDIMAGLTLA